MTGSATIVASQKPTRDLGKPGKKPLASVQRKNRDRHIDALLDAALEETFPASDPVAIRQDR
jgi:hypothetical protein